MRDFFPRGMAIGGRGALRGRDLALVSADRPVQGLLELPDGRRLLAAEVKALLFQPAREGRWGRAVIINSSLFVPHVESLWELPTYMCGHR